MAENNLKSLDEYQQTPDCGPRILFFSGGTALNPISRVLKRYTHNSVHLVTPFDSGGSSAPLRRAFNMPAVGDARSRMIALADDGSSEVYGLLSYRLPKNEDPVGLLQRLNDLAAGFDDLMRGVPSPIQSEICDHLDFFLEKMPKDFDLAGASIGNLVLAASYLKNDRQMDLALHFFCNVLKVQGDVLMTINDTSHLGAVLDNGEMLIGQHLITGKEVPPIKSPIRKVFLSDDCVKKSSIRPPIDQLRREYIGSANLICYAPGSFYSSVIANLLPAGVGRAISENDCPKVYAPALGNDPERLGMSLEQSIDKMIEYVTMDTGPDCPVNQILTHILLDNAQADSISLCKRESLQALGVDIIETKLVTSCSAPYYDPERFVTALLSLV